MSSRSALTGRCFGGCVSAFVGVFVAAVWVSAGPGLVICGTGLIADVVGEIRLCEWCRSFDLVSGGIESVIDVGSILVDAIGCIVYGTGLALFSGLGH
ncbi:hypothetical protein OOK47_53490 [Streptomyces sp. NBC_00268]|nr:hypothetical protein [Streptomyces sp. NBC_00268]